MPKDKYVHSLCPWRFYTFIHSLFQLVFRWWSAARHPRDLKALLEPRLVAPRPL